MLWLKVPGRWLLMSNRLGVGSGHTPLISPHQNVYSIEFLLTVLNESFDLDL